VSREIENSEISVSSLDSSQQVVEVLFSEWASIFSC
jgi:hypothetical protein